MKLNVFNEWDPLKEIVVGSCYNISSYNVDLSFKLFFAKNITNKLVQKSITLQKRMIEQRQEDLDSLAGTFKSHKIKVFRPEILQEIKQFKTPHFTDYLSPVDNPRDQTLIVGNEIIETSCQWRRRFHENELMHPIFEHYQKLGAKWSQSPKPTLQDSAFDFSSMPWEEDESLKNLSGDPSKYEIMFDGAQCLKFGRDIIMNVSTANHKLGFKWLKKHLGDRFKLHMVEITDHHIDGMLMPLRPGTLLVNPLSMTDKLHLLPKELQSWDIITVPEEHREESHGSNPQLASANINVNVLPINEKQVLIFDHDGDKKTALGKTLEKNGFEVIQVRLRHSRMFGGGAHCVTLDTVREGSLESYF